MRKYTKKMLIKDSIQIMKDIRGFKNRIRELTTKIEQNEDHKIIRYPLEFCYLQNLDYDIQMAIDRIDMYIDYLRRSPDYTY